ncbi:TorF family putative porin [Brevundimonas naejangsanensis]|uniref:TorF family putative porin n=1 Tax=Brevundimonas naejangsanensis TaxID=588932 RepID=UPI000E9109EB|nr:TorF family putative porin [Brevundimonas naejangsanensis]HAC00246.1 hypothetical protein [Brevundimonas sp.]HBV12185.1 hypothetical protein [Brevundimonas sp.]
MRKPIHGRRPGRYSDRNNIIFSLVVFGGIVLLGFCGKASAQEVIAGEPAWDVSANVGAASDYVFRGVSQTEEDAAISGGVDVTNGFAYIGAWASNVSYAGDPDTNAEVDLYGGIRPSFAGFDWDIGVVGYLYLNQPDGADYSYAELKVGASRAVGPATVSLTGYYSPDFFGAAEEEAFYLETAASVSPADRWTVSGALGRQWVSSDFDYATWNVGAAYALTDTLAIDVRYYDTDQHDFGDVYGSRAVVALRAAF